ncbi:hypothetical protein SNE40_013074 [Patella caerulea]|uniref:Uncharacterized protein n=1 Tax=Patella caerulea TaxID=87958 RepID=A0AAN8JQR6_PATCE
MVAQSNLCWIYLHLRQKGGAGKSDPLFINSKGMTLNRTYFIQIIKEIIESLGLLSDGYNGPSFRIGAATTAAKVSCQMVITALVSE